MAWAGTDSGFLNVMAVGTSDARPNMMKRVCTEEKRNEKKHDELVVDRVTCIDVDTHPWVPPKLRSNYVHIFSNPLGQNSTGVHLALAKERACTIITR